MFAHLEELSRDDSLQLEHAIDRFEQAWRQGDSPLIEEYLPQREQLRPLALRELIAIDLEYRQQAGQLVDIGDYKRRFSGLGEDEAFWKEQTLSADGGVRRIGKYDLLEKLGEGSFGIVFKAHDRELDRVVAIKVPHAGPKLSDNERERFQREARNCAPLQHPGIVAVHDAGICDGTCFLVTDWVSGQDLAKAMHVRRFTPDQSAALIAQTAEALDYAHQRGIIHRDLKPSNIIVDDLGVPHILDFGLARRETNAALTREGEILGTPAYMSPEQACGDAHRVDGRSDVYGLGVILYELLNGELPFRGNARAIMHQILEDAPRPPRRLNDAVPRDLETICLKALHKAPRERYASAAAFAADLRRYLAHQPVQARPVRWPGLVMRWSRRHPGLASLSMLLVFALTVGFAMVSWMWQKAEHQRQIAEDRFRIFQETIRELNVVEYDAWLMTPADTRGHRQQFTEVKLAFNATLLKQMQDTESVPSQDQAIAQERVACYLAMLNREEEALAAFERAYSLLAPFAARSEPNLFVREGWINCHTQTAALYFKMHKFPEALAWCQRTKEVLQPFLERHPDEPFFHVRQADTLFLEGCGHRKVGDLDNALKAFREAIVCYEQMQPRKNNAAYESVRLNHLARCWHYVGAIERTKARLPESRMAFEKALPIWIRLKKEFADLQEVDQFFVYDAARLGECYRREGDFAQVEKLLRLTIPLLEAVAKKDPKLGSRRLGESWTYLGRIAEDQNDFQTAKQCYLQAIKATPEVREGSKTWSSDLRQLAARFHCLGRVEASLEEWSEAERAFEQAIQIREKLCRLEPAREINHQDLAGTRQRLAAAKARTP